MFHLEHFVDLNNAIFYYRYLYLYMKKTNQNLDRHFDVLRDLIKLDITNDLAHEFFEMLKSAGLSSLSCDISFYLSCSWICVAKGFI